MYDINGPCDAKRKFVPSSFGFLTLPWNMEWNVIKGGRGHIQTDRPRNVRF